MQPQRVRRFRRALALSRGFTLIELLVVLAILGLLVGLVGPRVMSTLGGSKIKAAGIQIAGLGSTLEIYYIDVGRYPTTAEGLQALVENPGDVANWNGPYLEKSQVPKDPWGSEYQYRSPGEHGSFDLWSLGADNREGGEGENQDVYSWK
ncbi:type II secretion system major pseudopilin GspG [Candidatus Thiosymbion oneisti]|uniref:type II secretion system major pseudopilin GspG n=1 Tax=Candidatus Thiosymbion oneisti TaxID=589554 RepID=UPI000B7DD2B6|nr:type II secretion system major pseudopilin GspG [Candidatus Thiosymbion oneisti]